MTRAAVLWTLSLAFAPSLTAHAEEPDGGAAVAVPGVGTPTTSVAEPAYLLGERPRAGGAVQASVADEELARWNVGGTGDSAFVSNRPGFHPAPRVKVDLGAHPARLPERSGRKGTLSVIAVLAQARNHAYWPFRLCYEAGLRTEGPLRGKTHLHLTLARDGRVAASSVLSTDLHGSEVATCLAVRARALKFTPGPGRRTSVELVVDLNPGDAPLPGFAPPPGAPPAAAVAGSVDLGVITALFGSALPAILDCYSRGLARDPALWGRFGVRVDLDPGGRVHAEEQREGRFPDREVAACALAVVRVLPFPRPVGAATTVTWGARLGAPPRLEALDAGNRLAPASKN